MKRESLDTYCSGVPRTSARTNRRLGDRVLTRGAVWLGLLPLACISVESQPLDPAEVESRVSARGEDSAHLISEALSLFDEAPLGIELPDSSDPEWNPAHDIFWHTHALAFAPDVRSARGRVRADRELLDAAGRPDSIQTSFGVEDLSDAARQKNISATVDLLGCLGLGTSAAERDLSRHVAHAALGRLEEAAWRAVFAVDEARVQLRSARNERTVLEILLAQQKQDWRRIELLFQRGRLGAGFLGRARVVVAELQRETNLTATRVVRAREQLALASGLPPTSAALDALPEFKAVPSLDPLPSPAGAELLDRLPQLRRVRRNYALAEARLRQEASATWPTLRVGTSLKLLANETLTGGLLSLELPWPGVTAARVRAAVEERKAARELVEDSLAAALAEAQARRRELLLAQEHRRRDVAALTDGSRDAWRAARARMLVNDTQGALETWLDALILRKRSVRAESQATERELLARLAYHEATGGRPGLDPLLSETPPEANQ
jgi:outer membrane protein TolC